MYNKLRKMTNKRSRTGYRGRNNRKRTIYNVSLIVLSILLLSLIPAYIINFGGNSGPERRDFLQLWESMAFNEVFYLSGEQLEVNPLDYFLLTINGFSAYQLAIAQINNFNMLHYIDRAIWSLRNAMLLRESVNDGRLFYVLGKSYFYKGAGYGDLAIKYLEKARDTGFNARDIPEYLGLAYASAGDYRSSVAAFTMALNPPGYDLEPPSDRLVLSIASSYIAMGEDEAARAYLMLCLATSRNSDMISIARLSLGEILTRQGESGEAEALYILVTQEGRNAEAHFRLGEIYSSRGEMVRARSEWRRAIQVDPGHRQALSRLNL